MIRFAEKVRQSESNIKRRISVVNHFVVQQDQFAPVEKSVLRTEIAVHQAKFVALGLFRQCSQKTTGRGYPLGGVKVIGLQSQALEI